MVAEARHSPSAVSPCCRAAMMPARRILFGVFFYGLACEPEGVIPGDCELGVGVIVVDEVEHVCLRKQAVGYLFDPWLPGPERAVWPLHQRVVVSTSFGPGLWQDVVEHGFLVRVLDGGKAAGGLVNDRPGRVAAGRCEPHAADE